jgi:hypothetical protein
LKPRILLLDIETAPATAYVWKLFDENIGLEQLIAPSRTICWGAKWLGQRDMIQADERQGHGRMIGEIHTIMSSADAIVTYNGDRFDLPKLNGEFIQARLPPLPPITSIDLYKTVKQMGTISGKLAFIAPYLKIGKKMDAGGFRLWGDVLAGSKVAWAKMLRYNAQDTRLLGGLYRVLRPYIQNHPYLAGSVKTQRECPRCESRRSQSRGVRRTRAYLIERIQCLGCGGWYDGKRSKMV